MNNSSKSEVQRLNRDLEKYYVILMKNKERLEENAWLEKPISFWIQSARFLISEMGIWDQFGDRAKYERTFNKVRSTMKRVDQLIDQLTREE